MKVQVITRHAVTNYGSLLQAMATQKIISSIGHECEIVDYQRDDENYKNIDKTLLAGKDNWNKNVIKKCLYLFIRKPASIIAGTKFAKMQKEHLILTKTYRTQEELKRDLPEADVYMTGSDQVWGKIANGQYDGSYFLEFIPEEKYKVAFAASMGHSVKTKEEEELVSKWIKRYNNIAVREDSVVNYLRNIGIEAKQVLDPTLLVSTDEWEKIAKCKENKKYVLVYQIHNDMRLGKYAEMFAKKKNLPLIRISASLHQIMREGRFKFLPDIGEFLGYIKNAEYLITDSFHGTAFAINFNTQFVEILPNTNTGSRNQSILALTGLQDRIVTDMDDFSVGEKIIDFEPVNEVIRQEREKSIEILKELILYN